MTDFTAKVIAFVIVVLAIFMAGWGAASFVAWDWTWPLMTSASRVWLIICIAGVTLAINSPDKRR